MIVPARCAHEIPEGACGVLSRNGGGSEGMEVAGSLGNCLSNFHAFSSVFDDFLVISTVFLLFFAVFDCFPDVLLSFYKKTAEV
jgi:hypothetical protein